jgi:hypothetical protein
MASITISIPDEQVPRVAAAIGDKQMLGRDANIHEVKGELASYLKVMVQMYEKRKAAQALPEPDDLEVTTYD